MGHRGECSRKKMMTEKSWKHEKLKLETGDRNFYMKNFFFSVANTSEFYRQITTPICSPTSNSKLAKAWKMKNYCHQNYLHWWPHQGLAMLCEGPHCPSSLGPDAESPVVRWLCHGWRAVFHQQHVTQLLIDQTWKWHETKPLKTIWVVA